MAWKHTLGDLELLVLLALMRLGPEAYGVPIAREIEANARRFVPLGSVYAVLERLEARGLVNSKLGEATQERGGRAKRYFQVSAKGLREVRSTREMLTGMWQGIPALEGGNA
jgi:DNA-binding PadR family transcriptional regulator